jgi:hypothetical protein
MLAFDWKYSFIESCPSAVYPKFNAGITLLFFEKIIMLGLALKCFCLITFFELAFSPDPDFIDIVFADFRYDNTSFKTGDYSLAYFIVL